MGAVSFGQGSTVRPLEWYSGSSRCGRIVKLGYNPPGLVFGLSEKGLR